MHLSIQTQIPPLKMFSTLDLHPRFINWCLCSSKKWFTNFVNWANKTSLIFLFIWNTKISKSFSDPFICPLFGSKQIVPRSWLVTTWTQTHWQKLCTQRLNVDHICVSDYKRCSTQFACSISEWFRSARCCGLMTSWARDPVRRNEKYTAAKSNPSNK